MDIVTRVKQKPTMASSSKQKTSEPTSIEHLIALLISSKKLIADKSFIFSFFLSSRVFISSKDLLSLIFEKTIHYISNHDQLTMEILIEGLSRFMMIIKEWVKNFPHDFRVVSVMLHLKNIGEKISELHTSFANDLNNIFSYVNEMNDNLSEYEEYLKELHNQTTIKAMKRMTFENVMSLCNNDSKLMAIQLTHIELDRLSHISPEEFIHYFLGGMKFSTDKSQTKYEPKHDKNNFGSYIDELKRSSASDELFMETDNIIQRYVKTSSSLEAYISWFNRLSNFVASEIVHEVRREQRSSLISFFIDTAYNCFQLCNFNSSMAILAGLNMSYVSRLKKSWSKVNIEKFKVLTEITDSSKNYNDYRNLLANKFETAQNSNIIVIPIFTLVMLDLNHLFQKLSSKFFKGFINMERFGEISQYVTKNTLSKYKRLSYIQDKKIINHVLTGPVLTVDACAYASFFCEEPFGDNEIRYYKTLKSKFTK